MNDLGSWVKIGGLDGTRYSKHSFTSAIAYFCIAS